MFYLDLDELETIRRKIFLIGLNRPNVFEYRTQDHLEFPKQAPKTQSTKQHIIDWLDEKGIKLNKPKIMLLTNLRTFGYQFNPVSFYFIYENEEICCAIAEISNTFGEMKPFLLKKEEIVRSEFSQRTTKYFYVSPFIDHDAQFDFKIPVPDEKLNIRIDDYKDDKRFFISTLTGIRKELSNGRVWWYAIRFPFITLKVITLIHWNAFVLYLKKIKYHKKSEYSELQRDVYKK